MLSVKEFKFLSKQERLEYFKNYSLDDIREYVGKVKMHILKDMLSFQSDDIYTHELLIYFIDKDSNHTKDYVNLFAHYIDPYTIDILKLCCRKIANKDYIRPFFDRILEDNNGHIESDEFIYLSYACLSTEIIDYMYDHITFTPPNTHYWKHIVNLTTRMKNTPSDDVVIRLLERSGLFDTDESIQEFISSNASQCRYEIMAYAVGKLEADMFDDELGTKICHLAINYYVSNFSLLCSKINKSCAYVPNPHGETLADINNINRDEIMCWLAVKSKNPYS